jgi:hypothetical protein
MAWTTPHRAYLTTLDHCQLIGAENHGLKSCFDE